MKKHLAVWALSFIMLSGVLTGCGSGSSENTSNNTASTVDGAEDKEVISFWHLFSGNEAQLLAEVVEKFNTENTDNIYVEILEGTTDEKQLVAISGGDSFDVGQVIDTSFSKMSSAGMAADLDNYIANSDIDMDNFQTAVLELSQQDGVQYGLPLTMDSFLLFYNKDILEEIGETEPPKTISQLQDFAWRATVVNEAGDYERIGMVPDYPWIDIMNLPFHFGADFYDFETGTVTANSEANIEALEFKASFYNEPYDRDKAITFKSGFGQYQSADNPFFQGKVAFTIEGEWYPTFIEEFAPELNYGVTSIPYPDGREEMKDVGRLQTAVIYIPETSQHKDAAFKFLSYLVSDEAQLDFNIMKGGLPVTNSALNDPRLVEEAPALEAFVNLVTQEVCRAFPAVPFASEYTNALSTAEETIYAQGADPKEMMDGVVEKIQALADEWNSK